VGAAGITGILRVEVEQVLEVGVGAVLRKGGVRYEVLLTCGRTWPVRKEKESNAHPTRGVSLRASFLGSPVGAGFHE